MTLDYAAFLESKLLSDTPTGLAVSDGELSPHLYPFQHDLAKWALRRGRAALFCDCGLGKTPMQLEFAKHVPGDVLILTRMTPAPRNRI